MGIAILYLRVYLLFMYLVLYLPLMVNLSTWSTHKHLFLYHFCTLCITFLIFYVNKHAQHTVRASIWALCKPHSSIWASILLAFMSDFKQFVINFIVRSTKVIIVEWYWLVHSPLLWWVRILYTTQLLTIQKKKRKKRRLLDLCSWLQLCMEFLLLYIYIFCCFWCDSFIFPFSGPLFFFDNFVGYWLQLFYYTIFKRI